MSKKHFFIFAVIVLLNLHIFRQFANASISSCTASVSPTSVNTSTSQSYTFTLDSVSGVLWVQVTRPSANFTVNSASGSGWNASTSDSAATFTPVGQSAGSATISVTATSGSSEASSANWTVQVSDDANGTSPTTCGGTLGTAISGAGSDVTAPELSDITISDVGTSTVKITWTTNESSTSVAEYGTSDSYGSTKSDTTSVTSHSLTLTDLTHNTTYHFNLQSADSAGNTGESGDQTFTTAKTGDITPTPKTVTVTKADSTNPVVKIDPLNESVFKDSVIITGSAVDDTAVTSLEYTLDNGRSWNLLKSVKNLNTSRADFEIKFSGLTTGIYKIKVRGKDAKSNSGESSALTFEIDQKGPVVSIITDFSRPFAQSPQISGQATDKNGESAVEYSLDAGRNWQPVDRIEKRSAEITAYTFKPSLIDDGNYNLVIRAKDRLGNIGDPLFTVLIIDRLPPLVGGMLVYLGPQPLIPSGNIFTTVANISHKLVFSAIGGPLKINLSFKNADYPQGDFSLPLVKDRQTNLWTTNLKFTRPGSYELSISGEDGAGQKSLKKSAGFKVLSGGSVVDSKGDPVKDAKLTLFVKDHITADFHIWDGLSYRERNPFMTDADGTFELFLPYGTYYLEIRKKGFKALRSNIFTITNPAFIVSQLNLQSAPFINLGIFKIPLPYFFPTVTNIIGTNRSINSTIVADNLASESLNLEKAGQLRLISDAKAFSISGLRGKPTLITFVNSWWPQANQQLETLDKFAAIRRDLNIVAVFPQESDSLVSLYKKRGGYKIRFIADPDGNLAKFLQFNLIPSHFILNRSLQIMQKISGSLTLEELVKNVIE